MTNQRYTDAQIEKGIHDALQAQNVEAVASLIALLALQNPHRADAIRRTILHGLSIAQSTVPEDEASR
jgi:hypothetical protein